MEDERKTKAQVLEEVAFLRQHVAQMQALQAERTLLHQLAHDLVGAADTQAVADMLFERMQGLFGSDHREFMLNVNAAQAVEEAGGAITVSLRHVSEATESASGPGSPGPAAYVHLSVCDTGRGIDANMQTRIFEPFFTTRPVGEGYGLGLAVVHGIVSDHSGTIRVESAMGRGSTFHVYLPITEGLITG